MTTVTRLFDLTGRIAVVTGEIRRADGGLPSRQYDRSRS